MSVVVTFRNSPRSASPTPASRPPSATSATGPAALPIWPRVRLKVRVIALLNPGVGDLLDALLDELIRDATPR